MEENNLKLKIKRKHDIQKSFNLKYRRE